MNKTILRYSLYAVAALVIAGSINYLLSKNNYSTQEIGGYVSIVLSMLFVFFGVKQYRDKENSGVISYGKALGVGVLITILPSIAFGIFDIIYVKYLDPGFMERYYTLAGQKAKASMPLEKYQIYIQQMQQEKAMFSNPLFDFAIMALTVFIIGLVVAALSALILQRKQPKSQGN